MARTERIEHAIPPTFDERSRVLVLGTMPSPASRELGFNYGHPRNRFWRVMAQLAGEPVPSTPTRMRDFCLRHHIALWDVLAECDIDGASDASIRNAKPNPLAQITRTAPIEAVFCTGAKAHELYCRLCEADVGIPAVKLPSTSPANAACSFEKLVEAYAQIFEHVHAFEPPVLEVPAVVELEQTIAAHGTSLAELMNRAATALAWRVHEVLHEREKGAPTPNTRAGASHEHGPLVVVLCGNGNNGGDGWVAAQLLAQANVPVCVVAQKMPEELKAQPARDAAIEALEVLVGCGAVVVGPGDEVPLAADGSLAHAPIVLVQGEFEQVKSLVERASVVVDAIMGTGAPKAPREPFASWITLANRFQAQHVTIAADVPSGVAATTGEVSDPHITADETVTMIVRKPGLVAPECGRVTVAPLAYIEPYL